MSRGACADRLAPARTEQRWTRRRIRNFCIIAHIDHGKSTLADRLLELTGALTAREMQAQVLDSMDLERERGITIKAHTVTLRHRAADGEEYLLNLIDTPGHVDFSYEVSRSLAACEGALLVVDASQGVEAQTLANAYLASDQGLELVPVLNKIDLPAAEPERVQGADRAGHRARRLRRADHLGQDRRSASPRCSRPSWQRIPPPRGDPDAPLRALVFDASYDPYKGVRCLVRVVDGALDGRAGDPLHGRRPRGRGDGARRPDAPRRAGASASSAGEVGYLFAGSEGPAPGPGRRHHHRRRAGRRPSRCPASATPSRMVFAGLYPVDSSAFGELRDALEKLSLNDSAFTFQADTSQALGFGFRCGFLGLLHMEIVQERLEREFGLDLITTAPGGGLPGAHQRRGGGRGRRTRRSSPTRADRRAIEEPIILATILTPDTLPRRHPQAGRRSGAASRSSSSTSAAAACSSRTACRSPRSCSTSTTS